MSKSHRLTALSKSGDRLHRLAEGVTNQLAHVDTGFKPRRKQRGAAGLALNKQEVGGMCHAVLSPAIVAPSSRSVPPKRRSLKSNGPGDAFR